MTHLLDSSAWLAHLFGEPGVEQVNNLFDDPHSEVSISALSIPELYARLKSLNMPEKWPEVWELYSALFTKVISTDETIAHQAILLRAATAERLPTIDGLIAATAVVQQLTLVHRDPHIAAIPAHLLHQMRLPDK
jgi:predicted nucleic acid-binding protein